MILGHLLLKIASKLGPSGQNTPFLVLFLTLEGALLKLNKKFSKTTLKHMLKDKTCDFGPFITKNGFETRALRSE